MVMSHSSPRIGQILVENGALSQKQLDEALKIQISEGGLIGAILVSRNFIKEDDLASALAKQLNYPFLSLENVTINRNLIKEFSPEFLFESRMLPLEKSKDILTVAMADPSDLDMIQKVKDVSGCTVLAFVSSMYQIEKMIQKVFDLKESMESKDTSHLLKKATKKEKKDEKGSLD